MTSGSFGSLIGGAWVWGSSTGTPTVSKGAVTIKTTSSTSITSTSGVTLISDIGRYRPPAMRRVPRAMPLNAGNGMVLRPLVELARQDGAEFRGECVEPAGVAAEIVRQLVVG